METLAEIEAFLAEDGGQAAWAETGVRAQEYLGSLKETDALIEALANGWKDVDTQLRQAPRPSAVLGTDLFRAIPKEFGMALEGASSGQPVMDRAARLLRARAAGRWIAEVGPDQATGNVWGDVLWHCDIGVFLDEFRQRAISTRDAWVAGLSVLAQDPGAYVLVHDQTHRLQLVEEAEGWKAGRIRPFPRWRRGRFQVSDETRNPYLKLALLRSLDCAAWLRVLENLPLPYLTEGFLLNSKVRDDRKRILELIPLAASTRNTDRSPSGCIAAPILVLRAVELGVGLLANLNDRWRHSTAGDERLAEARELAELLVPQWYAEVAVAVASRPDAKDLLIGAAATLVDRARDPYPNGYGRSGWTAAEALCRKLAIPFGARTDATKQAWSAQEGSFDFSSSDRRVWLDAKSRIRSGSLRYWLVAVVAEAVALKPGERFHKRTADELWSWLGDLLIGHDHEVANESPDAASTGTEPVAALVLSSMTAPESSWKTMWDSLESQRFAGRTLMWSSPSPWAPSRFLLAIGLSALGQVVDARSRRALWERLLESALHLWLRCTGDRSHVHLVRSLAHLNLALPELLEAELATVAEYLIGEPRVAADVARFLMQTGAKIGMVRQVFESKGVPLLDYAKTARELADAKSKEGLTALIAALEGVSNAPG